MAVLAVSVGLEAAGGFAVLALGYGVTWAPWHFIFSPSRRKPADDGDGDPWHEP